MDKKEAINKVKEYGMDLEELPEKFKKDKDDINYHQLWNILVLQNWINKH